MEGKSKTPEKRSAESVEGPLAAHKDVLNPYQYMKDFEREAHVATSSITAKVMVLEPGEVADFAWRIMKCTDERVQKTLYLDHYTLMMLRGRVVALLKLIPSQRSSLSELTREKKELLESFANLGVKIHFTNPPKSMIGKFIPQIDRDHIKGTDIDNGKVFYIGGFNWTYFEPLDFMVKFTGEVATALSSVFKMLHDNEIARDTKIQINNHVAVSVDAGLPGESIILDEALQLIDGARDFISTTSMLYPDSRIAMALQRAIKRGVRVDIVSSGGQKSQGSVMRVVHRMTRMRSALHLSPSQVTQYPGDVHAKLLIIDGTQAYFGSNNLSALGVRAGTREWGIFTSDPELVKNLSEWFNAYAIPPKE